jgi:LysR family glycine cleavage system transcriptional activator
MDPRLPPLNALRTFVVTARVGSFNEAASELFVTPAAVSRSIKSLEDHLGCVLFHRSHRQITLTKDGQYYLTHLGDVFDQIALATQNLAAQRAHRPLVVCAFPSFIINWLIPRWSNFARGSSNLELKLVTTHTHDVDFEKSGVDAAILTDRAEYGSRTSEKLFVANLVPVCCPNYLPAGTLACDDDEWGNSLLHSETRPNDWQRWAKANSNTRLDPFRGQRFESSKLMYEAAIAGGGIAIGLEEMLQREFRAGALTLALPESKPAPCPFYLIRPASTETHLFFQPFREWLMSEVNKPVIAKAALQPSGVDDRSGFPQGAALGLGQPA